MEKARPFIAIALCLAVWAVYFKWFAPKKKPIPPKPPVAQPAEPVKSDGAGGGGPIDTKSPTPEEPSEFIQPEVAPGTATLQNDDLYVEFTTQGGSVQRLELRKFKDPFDQTKPLVFLQEFKPGLRALELRDPSGAAPLDSAQWEPMKPEDLQPGEIGFRYLERDGLRFSKIFSFGDSPHALRMKIRVENLSKKDVTKSFEVVGAAGILQEASGGIFPDGAHGLFRDGTTYSVEKDDLTLKDVWKKEWQGAPEAISWVGAENKFFACVMAPQDRASVGKYRIWTVFLEDEFQKKVAAEKVAAESEKGQKLKDWQVHTLGYSVVTKERTWKGGETSTSEYLIFAGPKSDEALAEGKFGDYRLPDLLDYGWFSWIARLLLMILHLFYAVFHNYGAAIICLVLVVRMAIYPVSKKGQVSMFRMQKLQPQIKALQEKYKGDPVRQNKESMALMKEHGVNPFGGCLPLFLQIPVFLGLYNALLRSIDLRQAPFKWWIRDLSQPDILAKLPFSILGATDLHLLPLIMTCTWFTQAFLQPRSPDPQMAAQQKMFMVMPVVIGMMMYSTPSGLVLYWLISTAWGICEQQFIKRTYLK